MKNYIKQNDIHQGSTLTVTAGIFIEIQIYLFFKEVASHADF